MPMQRPLRALSTLASALTAAGIVLAGAGCSHITPLGPEPAPYSLPPARDLGSPIIMQVMRSQPPAPTGQCPAGSVDLFGSDPHVPLAKSSAVPAGRKQVAGGAGGTNVPAPTAGPTTPAAPSPGVACFLPIGRPVTITSAAVSSVTADRNQPGPAWYEFVVAFPAADVPALTALIRQAYHSGDSLGLSVAGKLWQAPQPRREAVALRAEQINLLSRAQAQQLHRLLVPSG
jgi:hypothetical protein